LSQVSGVVVPGATHIEPQEPETASVVAGPAPSGGKRKILVLGGIAAGLIAVSIGVWFLVTGGNQEQTQAKAPVQDPSDPRPGKTNPNPPKTKPTKPTEPAQPKGVEKTKPSPPEQKPQPLPPAVVAAWQKAGFDAGWMGPHKEYGLHRFSESLEDLDASKAVPAFKARGLRSGVLESLPAPTTAFGLDLSRTPIPDAGLKELAKLQQLTSLDLSRTRITDAGLKELAKLQQLTSLDVRETKITDAGLKEVAKLQQLTSLNLRRCDEITDAGVAELKKALPKCEIDR
jgi:hypothetical protein